MISFVPRMPRRLHATIDGVVHLGGLLVLAVTSMQYISATFPGLSSFTYYPAIDGLSESIYVFIEAINLTVIAYLGTSGIAPASLGG